jgi:8-oxo-dGTP pyrophosphatase MutT (NUDIX family)
MNRVELINFLKTYSTKYPEEQPFIPHFLQLLKDERAYFRDHLPGHITGSAWIIDPSNKLVLLTHHRKLGKWLQPGGHADGEENILAVALKEAEEETGLKKLKSNTGLPFDIDIHPIPERNGFPRHFHYDVRFLFEADSNDEIVMSQESNDLAWIKVDTVEERTGGNRSILRMIEKSVALFRADQ